MTRLETPPSATRNLADHVRRRAAEAPDAPAVIAYARTRGALRERPPRTITTNAELEELTARSARALAGLGVERGDRVLVFVRPGADLVALLYALYALGAVPVLLDPGLGRESVLACIERTRPRVFVGIAAAHALRHVFRGSFASVEVAVGVGTGLPFCGAALEPLRRRAGAGALEPVDVGADAPAAILFTSGSTGPPKGVVYTHAMFDAQVDALKRLYAFEPGEVDVACLPAFGLFAPALGLTAVFPDLDATAPGRCDPARIVHALNTERATNTFGSPAIWKRVVPWCVERGVRLPSLRRVLIAGAPVPPSLIEPFLSLLADDADVFTPYGATECLPVASVSGRELLAECRAATESGAGTCVGRPVPDACVRLIGITDEPLARWSDATPVAPGELGEVCVRGAMVTAEYDADPAATRAAKLDDDGAVVHRMGDLGRFDDAGRLWFVGRKSHRLETAQGLLAPVPVETIYDLHPEVRRSALVGVGPRGSERPVLVVQLESGATRPRPGLVEALRAHGARDERAARVEEFLFRRDLPVDVRHNAKLRREVLKVWAEERLA